VLGGFVAEGTEFSLDGNFHRFEVIWRERREANLF
jgi:hypothetical protein